MIPLRDVIPTRTFPAVAVACIALNVALFLWQQTMTGGELAAFLQRWGMTPADGRWPAAFASMFLHAGWLHLAGNMAMLWIFGDNVEDRTGHGRFVVLYLLCGTVAAMAHVLSAPPSPAPVIGASGAIAGVLGAYFVQYPHSRVLTLLPLLVVWPIIEVPAALFLGLWLALQVFSSAGDPSTASPATAHGLTLWALVAGLASGALLIFAFRRRERARVEWWSGSRPRSNGT